MGALTPTELELAPLQDAPRILLVEDDVLLRMLLADVFRDAGIAVTEAASANEAQSYLKAGGEAHLIFSDIEMPGTMNGLQFADWLASTQPHIPLILTSGGSRPARNLPFISKPYSLETVVTIARQHLAPQREQK